MTTLVTFWWFISQETKYSQQSNLVTSILVTYGLKNEIGKCNLITKWQKKFKNYAFLGNFWKITAIFFRKKYNFFVLRCYCRLNLLSKAIITVKKRKTLLICKICHWKTPYSANRNLSYILEFGYILPKSEK